jgi:hypothetical protein
MPLYREDLQALVAGGCQKEGCNHKHDNLVVTSKCHPKADLVVVVLMERGVLAMQCGECRALICNVAIASSTPKVGWTEELFTEFKKVYAEAADAGKKSFDYKGVTLLTTYAKNLIDHLELQFAADQKVREGN